MTTRWAIRPLDPDAVQTANEKTRSQFEELGGRRLKMGPKDRDYREYWMDSYLEALSESQSIPTDPSDLQSVPPEDSDLMCIPVGEQVLECVPKLGTLFVSVSTCDGSPIKGAVVVLWGPDIRHSTTDENGIAVFSNLNPGDYEVSVRVDGYEDGEDTASVVAETSQSCAFILKKDLQKIVDEVNPSNDGINCGKNVDAVISRLDGTDPEATAPPGRNGSFDDIGDRHNTDIKWNKSFKDAFDDVKKGGDGTTAIVGIQYGGGGAHVVVMTNTGGKVAILEGQDWGGDNPKEVIETPERADERYNSDGKSNIGYGVLP